MSKITKRTVDSAQPPATGQIFIWDSELPGFGLRITPTRKTYIAQSRVNGKTVRTTLGLHGPLTPDQARREAVKHLGEMAKGVNLNQAERGLKLKNVTLLGAYQDYVEYRKLVPSTLKEYTRALQTTFADWQHMPITQITRPGVERRFDQLSRQGHAQANLHFRFLRALLNFAMEKYCTKDGEPLIPSNPCHRLTALKKWHRIERRTRYLEPNQLQAWFNSLNYREEDTEHRNTVRDFCAFILLTGCREQEAARITWDDVDLSNRTVTFCQTKNHRPHTFPVGKWLAMLLQSRKRNARSPYVFPADNKEGHLLNHHKSVLAIAQQSGVDFRLHDLRRTFASIVNQQLGRTFSAYTVKRLLNHKASSDVTGYIQFGVEDLREPMQAVETFVLKCAGITESASIIPLERKTNA